MMSASPVYVVEVLRNGAVTVDTAMDNNWTEATGAASAPTGQDRTNISLYILETKELIR